MICLKPLLLWNKICIHTINSINLNKIYGNLISQNSDMNISILSKRPIYFTDNIISRKDWIIAYHSKADDDLLYFKVDEIVEHSPTFENNLMFADIGNWSLRNIRLLDDYNDENLEQVILNNNSFDQNQRRFIYTKIEGISKIITDFQEPYIEGLDSVQELTIRINRDAIKFDENDNLITKVSKEWKIKCIYFSEANLMDPFELFDILENKNIVEFDFHDLNPLRYSDLAPRFDEILECLKLWKITTLILRTDEKPLRIYTFRNLFDERKNIIIDALLNRDEVSKYSVISDDIIIS